MSAPILNSLGHILHDCSRWTIFFKCFEIHPLTPLVGTPYLFSRHNYVKTSLKFNSVEETGLRQTASALHRNAETRSRLRAHINAIAAPVRRRKICPVTGSVPVPQVAAAGYFAPWLRSPLHDGPPSAPYSCYQRQVCLPGLRSLTASRMFDHWRQIRRPSTHLTEDFITLQCVWACVCV